LIQVKKFSRISQNNSYFNLNKYNIKLTKYKGFEVSKLSFNQKVSSSAVSLEDRDYNKGKLYYSLMEFDLARCAFEASVANQKDISSITDQLLMADRYNYLALCSYHLFDYDTAHTYMLKAIAIKEEHLELDDKGLQIAKENLADIEQQRQAQRRGGWWKRLMRWFGG